MTCVILFGKWHTPGLDREAQQGLDRTHSLCEEILAFWPKGSVPIINDLFKHADWIHFIESALLNLTLSQGCFVLWRVGPA